jgi:hypothetical protein
MGTGAFRSRGRAAGFGAAAAPAVVAVAGCGAAGSSAASGNPSSSGASSSGAAKTGGSAEAASAVQLAAKTAAGATSVSGTMSIQATVKAGATASPEASAGSAGSGDLSLSEILTPTALYLKSPALIQQLHLSKPWLSISPAQLSQGTGADLSQLVNSVTANGPLAQSQLLAGATSVRKTGTTSLGGVPVTEYSETIDPGKAAAALSGSTKSQLQQAIKTAGLSTGPLPSGSTAST